MTVDVATTQAMNDFLSGSCVDIFFCGSEQVARDVPSNLQDISAVVSGERIAMPLSLSALQERAEIMPASLTNFRPSSHKPSV